MKKDLKNCDVVLIRPHHVICLNLFRGKGYSDKFSKNMAYVLSVLQSGKELKIHSGKDDICSNCPNSILGRCITEKKVKRYDSGIYDYLKLEEGKVYSFDELSKEANISYVLDNVCTDCSWNDLCKDILKNQQGN